MTVTTLEAEGTQVVQDQQPQHREVQERKTFPTDETTPQTLSGALGMTGAEAKKWNAYLHGSDPHLLLVDHRTHTVIAPGQRNVVLVRVSSRKIFRFCRTGEPIIQGTGHLLEFLCDVPKADVKQRKIWKEQLLEFIETGEFDPDRKIEQGFDSGIDLDGHQYGGRNGGKGRVPPTVTRRPGKPLPPPRMPSYRSGAD